MATSVVNFRLEEETKKDMEEICEQMGISMSAAFTIFAKAVVRERRIPFEVKAEPKVQYEVVEIGEVPSS